MSEWCAPADPPARRLVPVRASSVKPARLRWLWDDRIPLGELTLLAGREGLGKSTVAIDLAAQVTRGELPGEYFGRPRHVVYVASEDSREHTIVPRLIAAGADLDRVSFIDIARIDGSMDRLVLPLDTEGLAEFLNHVGVGLTVLDAATSVLDSRLDGNKDREMRRALEPLAKLAQDTKSSILGIVHLGKAATADTGRAILGSIAWSQVARSVLAVAKDEDQDQLILSRTKGNLGMEPASLACRIAPCDVDTADGPTNVGRVEWMGETESSAGQFLAGQDVADERAERGEAAQWLCSYLIRNGGTASAADIFKAGAAVGFERHTLKRAKRTARVESGKSGFDGGWVWSFIREGNTEGNEGSTDTNVVPLVPFVSPSAAGRNEEETSA